MGTGASTEHGKLDYEAAQNAGMTIRAINHAHTRKILTLLDEHNRTIVTDIYTKLRMEQSVISQRLGILRRANVVIASRDGRNIYYSLNRKRIAEIASLVHGMLSDQDAGK